MSTVPLIAIEEHWVLPAITAATGALHVTSSGMFNPALMQHVLTVTTTDRLLFSTDYPFQQPTAAEITTFLDELATDADRDAVRSGNAHRLFGLDGRPGR